MRGWYFDYDGSGAASFFVIAESEDAARQMIEAELARRWSPEYEAALDPTADDDSWCMLPQRDEFPRRYKVRTFGPGEVVAHSND